MNAAAELRRARERALAGCALLALLALGACATHGYLRRREYAREGASRLAAARWLGGELALGTASRWLRHPTREEPWAAGHEGPGLLDTDPAGALLTPPEAVLREGLARARVSRRGPR